MLILKIEQKIEEAFQDALNGKSPYKLEHRIVRQDSGEVRYIKAKGKLMLDELRQPVKMYGVAQDITEQELAKEQLISAKEKTEDSEIRLNRSEKIGKIGNWEYDLNTTEIVWSNQLYEIYDRDPKLGPPSDEEVGNYYSKEDHQRLREYIVKIIETGEPIENFECPVIHSSGKIIVVLGSMFPVKDHNGTITKIFGALQDITERKKSEHELKKSEERFNLAMSAAKDGVYDWNLVTNEIYYSPGWKSMLGYKDNELPNDFSIWENLTEPEDVKKSWEMQQKVINKQLDRFELEFKMKHKKGHWVDILSRAEAVFNDNDKAIRIVGTHVDITDRKLEERIIDVELKLFEYAINHTEEELLQKFLDEAEKLTGSDIGFYHYIEDDQESISLQTWSTNTSNNMCQGSDEATKHYPISKAGVWVDCVDERKPVIHNDYLSLEHKKGLPDGHAQIIRELVVPVIRGEKIMAILGVGNKKSDYNESDVKSVQRLADVAWETIVGKQTQALLKENETKYKELFDNVGDAIFIYDPVTFEIYEANKATSSIYGYSHEELIGMSCLEFSAEVDKSKSIAKAIQNNKKIKVNFRHHKKKDGTDVFVELNTYNIPVNGKNTVYSVCHDITDIKKAEIDLIKAKEKAEESDMLKSAFLANMSHEIRTPMNGVLGFVNLLSDPNLKKDQIGRYSSIIKKSSVRLLNTINDIIDISKIEAGEMLVSPTETSINNVLDELYSFYTPEAKLKGLTLSLNTSLPDELATVITDSQKLHGILSNLIKNALKHTDNGNVKYGYLLKDKFIEFSVKDTGIGIPKKRINAIFNRFEQADIKDSKALEGSGLGLAISKAYVEMLGGKITVKSKEGKGSTFTFTIPYVKKEEEVKKIVESTVTDTTKINKLNLLIVEDDEVSSELLKSTLEGMFKEITFVDNGKDAIELCREKAELDLVLMDIKIPIINGYDATKEIRKFNKNIIIIAQTAYALPGDREKAINAGCDDYITKPISNSLLLDIISKLMV